MKLSLFHFFENLTKPFPNRKTQQPPKSLIAFCWYHSKGMRKPLLFMSIFTATLAMLEVYLFGFVGNLVDWLTESTKEDFFEKNQNELILFGVLTLFIFPLLTIIHSNLTHQSLLGNFPMQVRWFSHRYLLRQSFEFYQNDFAGRVATKVMQTALSVRETVMKLLDVIMYIVVYFSSMLFLVGQSHLYFSICLLAWLIIYGCFQYYFIPRLKRVSAKQADARSVMTGRIVDSYSNIATVKLFAHTDAEADYAKDSMDAFLKTVYSQMRLVTRLSVSIQVLNYLLVFVISLLSIYLWQSNLVSTGEIAVAIALALRLNGMSQWIMWEISSLFENIGAVIDGIGTLTKPQTIVDKADAKPLDVKQGKIEFDHVDFHYGKTEGVIDQLNLSIKPGEKVGVVGRSGAGKSTLVNLLMRFYDVESGEIKIDHQNIKAVTQDSLRSHIGMVTQDTSLLHRSVRENILYGKPTATEEELHIAIKRAKVDEFIDQLVDPNGKRGLDAQVGERGVKLSGGQRQRIAIARVLLKDAPILVLDEATSALDSEVEAAIQQSLYQLMEGKTVIAIAHRLSTIAAMDRLIVLDNGKIIEQGTHKELLELNGLYSQLWHHQTGGFLGED
ncbi:MAG: ABC transporter ATP-binding protein [Gammaproteobacteria bacterium]|nr:ABC transporter ATP-binding protein [Gammaproteobacteria bacterium]